MWFHTLYDCIRGLDAVSFWKRLESSEKEDESGSTATALFVGTDTLIIAHVGDSSVVHDHPFLLTMK